MTLTGYEAAVRELGAVLTDWVVDHQGHFETLELHGPWPETGMDPTWLLHLTSSCLDAEVIVFRGPFVEVASFDPSDADSGPRLEGFEGLTPQALRAILDDLGHRAGEARRTLKAAPMCRSSAPALRSSDGA